jgi:hypothetical protein
MFNLKHSMMNFINHCFKVKSKEIIFYSFLLLYLVFSVYLCKTLNVWEDEAYSLLTSSNNLNKVITQSYYFEGQPPAYFLILSIWRSFNSGIFFARLLSIIFVAIATYFFSRTVLIIAGQDNLIWLVIIFLLNPFTVWSALEIRLYSFLLFLSSISIYYFFLYILYNKKKYLYFLSIIFTIGMYTQFYFAFLIVSMSITLLVFKSWRSFFVFFAFQIPVFILFMPNLWFINDLLAAHRIQKIDYSNAEAILNVIQSPVRFFIPLYILNIDNLYKSIILISLGILFYLSHFKYVTKLKTPIEEYSKLFKLIIFLSFLLITFFCLSIPFTSIVFVDKYMTIAFPLLMLLFLTFSIYSKQLRRVVYGATILFYLSLLILQYKIPLKDYDYRSLAKYIKKIENIEEPLLFYNKALSLPFSFYYKGQNPIVPLPRIIFDQTYYKKYLNDTTDLKQSIEGIQSSTNSMLLITNKLSDYLHTLRMTSSMVDECLQSNYNITLDTNIAGNGKDYNLRIRRLEKRRL